MHVKSIHRNFVAVCVFSCSSYLRVDVFATASHLSLSYSWWELHCIPLRPLPPPSFSSLTAFPRVKAVVPHQRFRLFLPTY